MPRQHVRCDVQSSSASPASKDIDTLPYDALLYGERASDRVASLGAAALSRCRPGFEFAMYMGALSRALWEEPPPFGTHLYAEMVDTASTEGMWAAVSLITRAESSGSRARHLWSLAAHSADDEQQLKQLAVAESEHVATYLDLLGICLPHIVPEAFRSQLRAMSPGYDMDQHLDSNHEPLYSHVSPLDNLIRLNLADLRSLSLCVMQRPALLQHCPAENLSRATGALNSLIEDELDHVARTAELIERHARGWSAARVVAAFQSCIFRFNRATSEETIDYSYHLRFANYP